jgi:histidinol-phosphate phosphatase family protein
VAKPEAVLFDRDGTLVLDVPYNGDPDRVVLMPGAREALDLVRAAGIPIGVVSNQSAIGRGRITREQCDRVFARIGELLGPLGPIMICPHAPDDGCACRKPQPLLVLQAAAALGVAPELCAVIGDSSVDVRAAIAAGARAVLVPSAATSDDDVTYAGLVAAVAADLPAAVRLLLEG